MVAVSEENIFLKRTYKETVKELTGITPPTPARVHHPPIPCRRISDMWGWNEAMMDPQEMQANGGEDGGLPLPDADNIADNGEGREDGGLHFHSFDSP